MVTTVARCSDTLEILDLSIDGYTRYGFSSGESTTLPDVIRLPRLHTLRLTNLHGGPLCQRICNRIDAPNLVDLYFKADCNTVINSAPFMAILERPGCTLKSLKVFVGSFFEEALLDALAILPSLTSLVIRGDTAYNPCTPHHPATHHIMTCERILKSLESPICPLLETVSFVTCQLYENSLSRMIRARTGTTRINSVRSLKRVDVVFPPVDIQPGDDFGEGWLGEIQALRNSGLDLRLRYPPQTWKPVTDVAEHWTGISYDAPTDLRNV
ncbi:hypothetical protein HGRIS_010040 [Hohenbuehelia grisea]|uniref:Uncharacterized protein n=1 Tax=Hohenbuehelia grisea TaxID=104357 RepID=A0ABR3J332_9AGAR